MQNIWIDPSLLPEIRSNSEEYGKISREICKGIPITSSIGDQQAATLGQLCIKEGQAKNTYGTGCFMLMNTGTTPTESKNGLLTTALYQLGPKADSHYALEGSVAIAGQGVKWLRDNLGMIKKASEIEELANKVEDTGGVTIVPAFSGLFAPYWDSKALGSISGLTLHSTKDHICRAMLEAVCFSSKDILDAMEQDS
eukprot:UN32730